MPAHSPAETPTQPLPHRAPAGSEGKVPFYRRRWFAIVVTAVVAFSIGAASGGGSTTTNPKTTGAYKRVASKLASTQHQLDQTKAHLAQAKADLGNLPQAQAQLKADQAKLAQAQAKLKQSEHRVAARESAVAKRERKVGIVEKEVAANTLGGDGMYSVGHDMKPGTYKTSGSTGCYYAILNSTDTSDIADNNNVDGPAFVTVGSGQYFESQGCADWVLQH
jgi:hypothetical protein